ncbi:MAG: hypothetical protein PVF58_20745 [Candidatus Methanofastidiosia archaeon]|jgi:hypothetical protein
MNEIRHLSTVYLYFLKHLKDVRLSYRKFFKMQNAYKSKDALRSLLNEAYEKHVISKPEIFCNTGVSIELQRKSKNQLKLLKECKEDPETTYAIALCGYWSFLRVRKGASDLRFVDRTIPTYPSNIAPRELTFTEKGTLIEDPYPHGWDEIDWEVYYLLKKPSRSYTDALRESKKNGLGISRDTLKKRFKKIMNVCKVHMNFFPRGYRAYDEIFFTFKTEYELGLYDALKKLDRTSFLWKTKDFLILNIFVERYNASVKHFKEMEENGLIYDLKISIPIRNYSPFLEGF